MHLKPGHDLRQLPQMLALMCVYFVALNLGSIMRAESPAVEPVLLNSADIKKFTNAELRKLVAPIALYPDALLAQVLPASTYPLQVVAAYRHVQTSKDPAQPPAESNWDTSVIALLNYPTVLKKLNDDLDWTERLGLAVTYQMNEVSDTIQQVRAEASVAGNLDSSDKQTVVRETGVIRIVPANPEVIYVPAYDPEVIFDAHDSWEPFITFGIGFGVGVWLDDFWDWHYHRFCRFHTWSSGGWYRAPGTLYWHAPYRQIPTWYRRGSAGPPVSGNRLGTYTPQPPAVRSAPSQTHVQPERTQGLTEGQGRTGQEVRRDANRGAESRQSIQQAPRTYSIPHQNMMSPSDGQSTRTESSRGAMSRSGSFGGGRSR